MTEGNLEPELRVNESPGGESVIIEGDLTSDNAAQLEGQLRALKVEPGLAIVLDLSGLDIDDGVALATAINSLRELRNRAVKIVITGAPQMLGHNLYRVGLLDGRDAVELIDMRLDEPGGD
ncbi:MAG TPA: STAS domain-containing protein [Blastocatellia bacterium]